MTMRSMTERCHETRKALDALTPVADGADALDVALIAMDACRDERGADVVIAILGTIPAIKLGRTMYRVTAGGTSGMSLAGPRGGWSHLTRCIKTPDMWGHVTMSGNRTTWYRRGTDGAFTLVS